ncbi:type II toxin-antitoxin system HipA family toxin [Marinovum sp.]|uniref:type II toxin-antitoxin system HipA family toxin n=1 Tax=Marinovum sp. TaxID=2024839 RepID=UPI003A90AE79
MTTVEVYFARFRVGRIDVRQDGALGFTYDPAWLATEGAFPISLSMPLRPEAYPSQIISPWLANLLPEEEQLDMLTRSLGRSRADVLGLLSDIGGDTAGALSFGTPSDPAAWRCTPLTDFYDTDDPGEALDRHFADLDQRPFLAGEDSVRLSLAGGQKKSALAVLDAQGTPVLRLPRKGDQLAIPQAGAPSTVILKPDNPRLPGIAENEVYCLRLAAAIGLPAAEAATLVTPTRTAICVLRYDRRLARSGSLQRIHQEDFAQANSLPPGRKYEHGTVPGLSLHQLLETGRRLGPRSALGLLDQVIFNILVANTDGHAKNYSLLLPLRDGPRLSPLYDVSTVLMWPHVVQKFAQTLAGKRRKPGKMAARHWETLAETSGFRPADVMDRVQQLVDRMVAARVATTKGVSAGPGVTPGYVEETARLIEKNALRIAGRLSRPAARLPD